MQQTAEGVIAQTLYATISHNLPVMIYVAGVVLSLALLLYRPNRRLVLFLVGFALLAFHFEYVKHIASPLLQQTQVSIESQGYETLKARRLMDIFFQDFVPVVLFCGGWGLIFLGIIVSNMSRKKLSSHTSNETTIE